MFFNVFFKIFFYNYSRQLLTASCKVQYRNKNLRELN